MSIRRRPLAAAAFAVLALLAGCTSSTSQQQNGSPGSPPPATGDRPPSEFSAVDIPAGRVDAAVGRLDGIVNDLLRDSHIPGMAVAVVHGGKTVYAKGFGLREVGKDAKVDPDTVFQLASVSKPVASTVVAHEVGAGAVQWTTPIVSKLPWFALRDPWVTQNVTIADMLAHRSGLPDHAGDELEDLGFDQRQVLEKLRQEPLDPFRITYQYTNFGVTAAAEAVAAAAGTDWSALSEKSLYQPLGMTSTSSRYADFTARPNRAVGHVEQDGKYVVRTPGRDPDAQSPAGGVSASVNDMTHWLAMLLGDGKYQGKQLIAADALLPAVTPQIVANSPDSPAARAGFYGYGFNVGTTGAGRETYSHSGAFALGAGTNFLVLPSADVAIVALSNAAPTGVPETITAEFSDLVQFGEVRQDWRKLYKDAFASMDKPQGSLVGQKAPTNPAPAQPSATYAGVYNNDFWGPAAVSERDGGLVLALGPKGQTFPLRHWEGDTFTFTLDNENAPPGTVSKATFAGNSLTLEYYDTDGLGRFTK